MEAQQCGSFKLKEENVTAFLLIFEIEQHWKTGSIPWL
jgi:hypothetical protein